MSRIAGYAVGAVLAIGSVASAQRAESTGARPLVQPGRAGRGVQPKASNIPKAPLTNQQVLARQVRQRFALLIKRSLALTDDQSRQLAGVETRFQQQRTELQRDERTSRLALRTAMLDSVVPDQARISQYMTDLVRAQHRRADLLEAEQKELSAFLTPLQRAKYQALHDQLNHSVQELRKNPTVPEPPPMR